MKQRRVRSIAHAEIIHCMLAMKEFASLHGNEGFSIISSSVVREFSKEERWDRVNFQLVNGIRVQLAVRRGDLSARVNECVVSSSRGTSGGITAGEVLHAVMLTSDAV